MIKYMHSALLIVFILLSILCDTAFSASIGKIVALRGAAIVERGGQEIEARVNVDIEASDTVKTQSASKIKLLFVDGSILTLGEKTHLVVKEFVDGKGDRGKSIFNLLDGKMRSVVGHTKFEVETPTAVAAARGTVIYFDVRALDGHPETTILCLEGTIDVKSLLADVPGTSVVTAGEMIIIKSGTPFTPVNTPPALLNSTGSPISGEPMGEGVGFGAQEGWGGGSENIIPILPPINQEPLQPLHVEINIEIPM